MRNEGLQFNSVCRKIGGPEVATNEPLALDITNLAGGRNMPENTGNLAQNDSASNPLKWWTVERQEIAAAVIRGLREGFGVEDIAIKAKCDPSEVRSVIARLRATHLIEHLYDEARASWRTKLRKRLDGRA